MRKKPKTGEGRGNKRRQSQPGRDVGGAKHETGRNGQNDKRHGRERTEAGCKRREQGIRKKLNQAQLHKELQHRKMRPNETVFQYLVAIRELANRGQGFLDETSIMEYCINGIPDSPSNKLILYGCTTIQEFKEKLGIYDKIFQNKSKNHSYDTSRSPNFSSQRRDVES
ncbi:uncharacterized protein TNCV_2881791 [Trichonephila clavipes]|nr:uncharacterized protein TNCV_2881791 [Trichonephila clavipes]